MEKEQFRQLKKKSDELTQFLWKCPLTRQEAWTFYYACYLPSVGYPLSCSSLSRQQLDEIQRKAMTILVARCGYNRNTKKEFLYGPLELGGANFRPLYVQQGVGQISTFIRHWRLNSPAGKLLKIAASWFQLQTGVSYPILEYPNRSLPHFEAKWLKSLRQFLADFNMKLQLNEDLEIPRLQRENDRHIMDIILDSEFFSPRDIRGLNYCRLYLQAATVSDLSHIDGTRMDQAKLCGTFSVTSSRTPDNGIHQERPAENEWCLWRRMCKKLLCTGDGTLYDPLGAWTLPRSQQRQQHQAYYESEFLCVGDSILWV